MYRCLHILPNGSLAVTIKPTVSAVASLLFYFTNAKGQIPSQEANSCSGSQDMTRLYEF
jgi:hypothetical protein